MKILLSLLIICVTIVSCSNKKDIDSIVSKEYEKCNNNATCVIDFAERMNFEWDTMCFYSGANSLEDINKDLGFELKEYTDIGDRVIFLKNNKVVYQKEWFPNPSEPTEGIIFETNNNKLRVSKSNSKFKIRKENKTFYLEKL